VAAFARSLRETLPEAGTGDTGVVFRELFERIVPPSFGTTNPGFMAYVPGGGLPHAAVADLVTGVVNRYIGVWRAAPGLVQLETNVVRWLADLVGLPETALGTLTTGGSLASLTALVAARSARLGEDTSNATIYVSDQVHHSVTKAAIQVGFGPDAIREIPSDDTFRMRPDALRRHVAEDRAGGLRPFLVVGSAGTTNTGAVDDLEALATVAADEALWFHVDAAYGGFFLLTERGRRVMQGIERADSLVLDPHKGLFLPYGTGAVLVRDGTTLRRAFGGTASYMPTLQDEPDLVDFCEISPELSRECRGLRLWLPIKMHGVDTFRRALDEKLDLTAWATAALREIDSIEIVAEPQLSTVAFRLMRPDHGEEELTRLNRELLERIDARQRVLLTSTTTGGRFLIRICIVSFRTHFDRVQECVQIIRDAVEELRV
jgi:aromatic-L-amino-acid decarboxylase